MDYELVSGMAAREWVRVRVLILYVAWQLFTGIQSLNAKRAIVGDFALVQLLWPWVGKGSLNQSLFHFGFFF